MNTSDNVTSVGLRPFEPRDVAAMERWARHTDPLFSGYDVPELDEASRRAFFERSTAQGVRSYAGVVGGNCVAHVMLRNIDPSERTAELAIALDPAWIGRGIGTQLLRLVLAEARRAGIARVDLDVASYNLRALRAYAKAGFVETRRRWVPYDTPADLRALAAEPGRAWLHEHVRIDTGYMISLVHMRADTSL